MAFRLSGFPWHSALFAVSLVFAWGALASPAGSASLPTSEPLRIAVAAMISAEATIAVYQGLMEHIGERLGRPVELKQRRTYQEVNDMLGTGKLDAALLCSGTYVHARRQYGVELLAVPVIRGSPTYHSYLIVHASGDATSLADLKGKRFAFTDPLSTSGYLYPMYALVTAGQRPATYFAKTLFTYSHDNSVEAVAEGVVDGAGVDSLIYNYLKISNPTLVARTRLIARSPPLGSPPVAVPKGLPRETKRALREVFLTLDRDPGGQAILRQLRVDRFIPGDDRLYDRIRRMLRTVEGRTR